MKKLLAMLLVLTLAIPIGLAGVANENPVVTVYDKIVVQNGATHPAETISVYDSAGKLVDSTNSADAIFWLARTAGQSKDYIITATASGYQLHSQTFTVSGSTYQEVFAWYYITQKAVDMPAKPVLTATATDTQANLVWTYSGPAVTGFNISRDGNVKATVGPTVTTYTDTGLTAGTTYKYIITAYNTAGNTASDEVSVTTPQSGTTGDIIIYDLNFKDQAAPGSDVSFDLELKNNATYDAEHVVATVIIHSIGANKDDLKTDVDFGTISTGDKQTESVTVTIPQDADDKLYTVSVDLAWKDEAGNHYTGTYTATDKLEIVKVKHQISITNVQLDGTQYKPGSTVQLAVSLLDSGANAETVQLKAASDIGASATGASFKMNEGDATTQYLSFTVPDGAKAGKYFIVVTASYGSTYSTKSIVMQVATEQQPTVISVVQPTTPQNGAGIPVTDIALAVVIILLIGAVGWLARDTLFPQKAARPIVAARARR